MTAPATACLEVVQPGLATTVQDRGRHGWQRFGVPVSGALDIMALAAANTVVGNEIGEAALECLYQGCEVTIHAECTRLAVAGAGAALDIVNASGEITRSCPALESTTLHLGQRARVRMAGPSISAYLAVEGGFDLPLVLGSRSTFTRARFGGFDGRAIRPGDLIALNRSEAYRRGELYLPRVLLTPPSIARIVPGPQDDHFQQDAWDILTSSRYAVATASDRMGLRLEGPRLRHEHGADIVSDGIPPGAIQVPGNGLPIVMLADRQTTGGYTKIATVISADLPGLGRLGPGSSIAFEEIDVAHAEHLARQCADEMAGWRNAIREVGRLSIGYRALLEANLISGVVNARDIEAQAALNV